MKRSLPEKILISVVNALTGRLFHEHLSGFAALTADVDAGGCIFSVHANTLEVEVFNGSVSVVEVAGDFFDACKTVLIFNISDFKAAALVGCLNGKYNLIDYFIVFSSPCLGAGAKFSFTFISLNFGSELAEIAGFRCSLNELD